MMMAYVVISFMFYLYEHIIRFISFTESVYLFQSSIHSLKNTYCLISFATYDNVTQQTDLAALS